MDKDETGRPNILLLFKHQDLISYLKDLMTPLKTRYLFIAIIL